MSETHDSFHRILQAIADPTRRRILRVLKKKDEATRSGLCASDIEMRIHLSQPTISHHMSILEKAGLVEVQKAGLWRWYRRNDAALRAFTRKLGKDL